MERYLDHRRGEVSDRTLQSHEYRLKPSTKWGEENDLHNLNDLTGRDLHAYRVDRREDGDLKPISLQTQLSTVRVFIRFCESLDAVPTGLHSKILLPTVPGDDQASQSKLDHARCEATEFDHASTYPSSRSPHEVRSGSITAHLLEDVPGEIVSERMDVSKGVLDRHYDRRTKREKMLQRRKFL